MFSGWEYICILHDAATGNTLRQMYHDKTTILYSYSLHILKNSKQQLLRFAFGMEAILATFLNCCIPFYFCGDILQMKMTLIELKDKSCIKVLLFCFVLF